MRAPPPRVNVFLMTHYNTQSLLVEAPLARMCLTRRATTDRRCLDSYTEQHRIMVLTAPKGVRKEEVITVTFWADHEAMSLRVAS